MQKTKEITVGDQLYRLNKFTPSEGFYWAGKVFANLIMIKNFTMDDILNKIQGFVLGMSRQDSDALQKDCLNHVYLVNADGSSFKVGDALTDIPTTDIFQLTLHSFMFSMTDFFDPALISGLMPTTSQEDSNFSPIPPIPPVPLSV